MDLLEIRKDKGHLISEGIEDETVLLIKRSGIDLKENSAGTASSEDVHAEKHTVKSVVKVLKDKKSEIKSNELIKNKVEHMLNNEEIVVGYTSMTELYLNNLLKENPYQGKEVINLMYRDYFSDPKKMQKFIEVMSNVDYELLYPTNTILAVGVINHIDIGVQEAAIAAYEKWDDKRNITYLQNINYTADWIREYAENVIQYLEGC